jgi:hypothetical protein
VRRYFEVVQVSPVSVPSDDRPVGCGLVVEQDVSMSVLDADAHEIIVAT